MLKGSLPEIFLDTDVAFDILSKRKPHFQHSVRLLELAAEDKAVLLIAESSLLRLSHQEIWSPASLYLSIRIYN